MLQNKWMKIVLGILGVLVLALLYVYLQIGRPVMAIGRGIAKLGDDNSSLQVKYQAPDDKASLTGEIVDFNKSDSLSRVMFETTDFKLEGRVGKNDLYLQADYAQIEELAAGLKTMDPMILRTATYRSLVPMLSGASWLHFPLPAEWWKVEDTKTPELPKKEMARLTYRMLTTLKINSYKDDVVVMGLRKQGLLALIEDMKDMNIDVKLSQINAIKRVVESSDDWDGDLLEFHLDKEGRLVKIVVRMPEIDQEVLSKSIEDGFKDEKGAGQAASSMSKNIAALIGKGAEAKYIELGSLSFDKFGEVESVEAPTQVVEWKAWSEMAMKEFGPLIMQIMGAALGQPTQNPGMMRTR